MDLKMLAIQLEFAGFRERENLARQTAQEATPSDLAGVATFLTHKNASVRLGAVEILGQSSYRDAIPALTELARNGRGDERVFAIRALSRLATPRDTALRSLAQQWAREADEFVQIQARTLLAAVSSENLLPAAPTAPVAKPTPVAAESLAHEMLAATSDTERLKVLEALRALDDAPLTVALALIIQRGNASATGMAAGLVRARLANLTDGDAELQRILEDARTRHTTSPAATEALDLALITVATGDALARVCTRAHEQDNDLAQALLARLDRLRGAELASCADVLTSALLQRPERTSRFVSLLVRAIPELREGPRGRVKDLALRLVETLAPDGAPDENDLQLARLLQSTVKAGDALPMRLLGRLERGSRVAAHEAVLLLCARCATEEAARKLVSYLADPVESLRTRARELATSFQSTTARLELKPDGTAEITPIYRAPNGELLEVGQGSLRLASTGDAYVLDARGQPVRAADTPHGGCQCCARPRALVRQGRELPRCPQSGEPHLVDGKAQLLREHPLGRCRNCESIRPLKREGERVVCPVCRREHVLSGGAYMARPGAAPSHSSESPASRSLDDALPTPPSRDDLKLIEPPIARAMAANIFLVGKAEGRVWCGSGVIIARDGEHVLCLTNRHVVEEEGQAAELRALTLSGEKVPIQIEWVAPHDVDLALVSCQLRNPDAVTVMELGQGACLVGSPLFAIGNPMGLNWSYSSGALSAFRRWENKSGLELQWLQTQTPVGPGSSGGGLYHADGHLVGIITFIVASQVGGDAHFALSMSSIRETLHRDDVSWRAKRIIPLLEGPPLA
ncbi:MAG: trypsin-like peptidase domain-containing protein [Myxococcota bacterium]